MSKETSETVATVAGRVLSRGNPLDDPTFVSALIEGLALSNSGAAAMQACRTAFQPYMEDMLSLAGSALSQVEPDKIVVPVDVNWEHVANAIVGAVEGGADYWLNAINIAPDAHSQEQRRFCKLKDQIWYSEGEFWRNGGRATFSYDDPEGADKQATRTIGKTEIMLGLKLMAEKAPRHFGDLISENDDATTHDVLIQYVLLGDIIYG